MPEPEACDDSTDNDCDGFTDGADTQDCASATGEAQEEFSGQDVTVQGVCGCSSHAGEQFGYVLATMLVLVRLQIRKRKRLMVSVGSV